MVPVISERKWRKWCVTKGLPIDSAIFALETCYYRARMRSRPGTLLLTRSELIHYSYSWRESLWAVGEPSIRVTIPLTEVVTIYAVAMRALIRVVQLAPDSMFRVATRTGTDHELILQRNGSKFRDALAALGLHCVDERTAD